MISRRAFLRSALVGSALVGAGAGYRDLSSDGYTGDFIIERMKIPIPGLPPAFDGYRIGFITDIHIGVWVPEEWLTRAIDAVAEDDVDILVLGGDYILVNDSELWQRCGVTRNEKFAALSKREAIPRIYETVGGCFSGRSFRDGIVAVVGNHDHWNMYSVFQAEMRRHPNIRFLINEEMSVTRGDQELLFFGVDDYLTGIPALPPQRPLAPSRARRIIVSHNPDYMSAILSRPDQEFSLALCGHTHGGQIVLPIVGPIAAQVIDRRFISGLFHLPPSSLTPDLVPDLVHGRMIYTSRGLGVVGLPYRFNCPPEVTIFTLTRP